MIRDVGGPSFILTFIKNQIPFEYILKKIILRSMIASIIPIIVYSVWFILFSKGTSYINQYFLYALMIYSLFHSFNHIGLWIIFTPIDMIVERRLKASSRFSKQDRPNPILKGNFGPIQKELSYEVTKISGKVPQDINGVFIRNGPNPKWIPENKCHHWFDGDAMLHVMRLKNGELFYCNEFIQGNRFKVDSKAGKAEILRLGELNQSAGIFKSLLIGLKDQIGFLDYSLQHTTGSPNTALIHHSKKTYALVETNLPFNIKIDQSEKRFDIVQIGEDNFRGQLKHAVSAHPKVNHKTGEFYAFGYDMNQAVLHYTLFSKHRLRMNEMDIKITSKRMIHDFPITENFVIFPDLPMEFNPEKTMRQGGAVFSWDKSQKSKYGIMRKMSKFESNIQWFTLPNHWAFHYINAWETQNSSGQLVINLYVCDHNLSEYGISFEQEHPFFKEEYGQINVSIIQFNMITGEATMRTLLDDLSYEFPIVNTKQIGFKTRYAYIAYQWNEMPQEQAGKESMFFEGFIKYDLQEEKVLKNIKFGQTKTAGEVFFHQKDGEGREEDDGYCMTFIYDWKTKNSEFVMWDAQTMSETPILKAEMEQRVPQGFHSYFVQENDLEK